MQVLDLSTVLSMQQTTDYQTHLDTEAPVLDKDDNFWSNLPLLDNWCANPIPLDGMPEVTSMLQSSIVTTTTIALSVMSASGPPHCQYGSPKKDSDVLKAQESSIPAKTKATTN